MQSNKMAALFIKYKSLFIILLLRTIEGYLLIQMNKKLLSLICLSLTLSACFQIQPKLNKTSDDDFDVELMKDVRSALKEANPQVVVSYDNDYDYDFQRELSNQPIADSGSQNSAILEVDRDFTFDITVNEGIPYHLWDHEIL